MKAIFIFFAATALTFGLNLQSNPVSDREADAVLPLRQGMQKGGGSWDKVWPALQGESIPDAATVEGGPICIGDRVLFRFHSPDARKVFLSGSFNGFAQNHAGHVSGDRFAMRSLSGGMWYGWARLGPGTYFYKYVVESENGDQHWIADPHGQSSGQDGNSLLQVPAASPAPATKMESGKASSAPALGADSGASMPLEVRPEKIWVKPDERNTLVVTPAGPVHAERLDLQITTPLGDLVYTASLDLKDGENRFSIPPLGREGGYLARVTSAMSGGSAAKEEAILSVVQNIADDLRYGFFATYRGTAGNYSAKTELLSRLHINAVEFYDYFPAHGCYAPKEQRYRFEPFCTEISAVDVQRKIAACHQRNILPIAYIAAYAASESVYRKFPYPMTDENGTPKIFNGEIMPEDQADREGKPKWFWLMNVAGDSPWRAHLMRELGRALDDGPSDMVSFDGFEIDTYGDSPDAKFYAKGSRQNGAPLRDVLRDLVRDVHSLTHEIKPRGLVSFNCVNEFGVEQMYGLADFLFLEIWRSYTDQLGALVDICAKNHKAGHQRVVLKMYPADMKPGQTTWPTNALRRVLGAAMTGGGTLMVAGEPDERNGAMHGLATMFYPDHQPLGDANEAVLRAYYHHDAMLLGYTHGRDVFNAGLQVLLPGCIARTFASPANRTLVVQLLHIGTNGRWSADEPTTSPLINQGVSFPLPGGIAPKEVFYASPDSPALQTPVRLDFDIDGGNLRATLPELVVHATLILRYD